MAVPRTMLSIPEHVAESVVVEQKLDVERDRGTGSGGAGSRIEVVPPSIGQGPSGLNDVAPKDESGS